MPRKPNPTAAPAQEGTTTEILDAKGRALAVQATLSSAVSAAYGEGVAYERERAVGQVRVFMATSAEAMLEAGKALIQIKENEPHGEFLQIVEERLGLSRRMAQVMMQAAVRYMAPALQSKAQAPALLGLGKAKLLELLIEPDEGIQELADGGTLAGLTLDDMQTMSSRELREALREARRREAAKDRVIAKKDAKLNELSEAEEARLNGTRNEKEAAHIERLRDLGLACEQSLQKLVGAAAEVFADPPTQAAELQARQTLEFIGQRFADLCGEAHIGIEILGERVEPGWRREISAAVAQRSPRGTKGS